MLTRLEESKEIVAIDYREKAPKSATKDMFLDKEGKVDKDRSRETAS